MTGSLICSDSSATRRWPAFRTRWARWPVISGAWRSYSANDALASARSTLAAEQTEAEKLIDLAQEQAAGLNELDGLRKHSLLQIDQARAEARLWKAEFERVDLENKSTVAQYRQKAATLENALAAARGHLGAAEEALAAAQQHGRDLESALVAANATPSAMTTIGALGQKRFGAGKLRTGAVVRRKKL